MQPQPFSPLAPGENDFFAFDFTSDAGTAEIVSTSWTCALLPPYAGSDPSPQARVLITMAVGSLQQPARLPALPTSLLTGQFSLAQIGGFPVSALGSWYVLTATATLNDGRILQQSANVMCSF
jgi:hypothetical protein